MTSSRTQTLTTILILAVLVFYTTIPDQASSLFSSTSLSAFWTTDRDKTSAFVKGIVFVLTQPSSLVEEEVATTTGDDEAASDPFPNEAARCIARVKDKHLPHLLSASSSAPSPLLFVARQLGVVQKQQQQRKPTSNKSRSSSGNIINAPLSPRMRLLNALSTVHESVSSPTPLLADVQHEHWVVQPWLHIEGEFPRDVRVIRAIGACLRGGGLGLDKPHSESHWAERGASVSTSMSLSFEQDKHQHHPFFFPLHGGVSPRRVIRHSLRCAEYFGIPTDAIRNADGDLVAVMGMPRQLDFAPASFFVAWEQGQRQQHQQQQQQQQAGGGHHQDQDAGILGKIAAFVVGGGAAAAAHEQEQHLSLAALMKRQEAAALRSLFSFQLTPEDEAQMLASQLSSSTRNNDHHHHKRHQHQQSLFHLDSTTVSDPNTHTKVIVDLGCGHGAMLASICPPHPRLWCYGVDFTQALVKQALHAFPHIDFRHGVTAPHLPSGSADSVLSNGVAGVIRFSHNCEHFSEILRLLKPRKGTALIWHLSSTRWARFHPSFFGFDEDFFFGETASQRDFTPDWKHVAVDPGYGAAADGQGEGGDDNSGGGGDARDSFMAALFNESQQPQQAKQKRPHKNNKIHFRRVRASSAFARCPNQLWRYVARIDIIADDPHAPLYTPTWDNGGEGTATIKNWPGTFGVRIFRNGVKFVPSDVLQAQKETAPEMKGFRDRRAVLRQEAAAVIKTLESGGAAAAAALAAQSDGASGFVGNSGGAGGGGAGRRRSGGKRGGSRPGGAPVVSLSSSVVLGGVAELSSLRRQVLESIKQVDEYRQRNRRAMANFDFAVAQSAKKYPLVLSPPTGLTLMMKTDGKKQQQQRHQVSSSTAVGASPIILKRERRKYRRIIDIALKCEFYDRRGGKGWCPEGRGMI